MKRKRVLRWGYGLAIFGSLVLVMFGYSAVRALGSGDGGNADASVAGEEDGRYLIGPSGGVWIVPVEAGESTLRVEFEKVESIGGYGKATTATVEAQPLAGFSVGSASVQQDHPWGEAIVGFEDQFENQARSDPYRPTMDVPLSLEERVAGEQTRLVVAMDIEYPVMAEDAEDTLAEITSDSYTIEQASVERDLHLRFATPEDAAKLAEAALMRPGSPEFWAILGTGVAFLAPGVGLVLHGRKMSPF